MAHQRKRNFAEEDGEEGHQQQRHGKQLRHHHNKPPQQNRKNNIPVSKAQGIKKKANAGATDRPVAQRIRDTERLLRKKDLPDELRKEKEELLETLKKARDLSQKRKAEQKLSKKYHMVKFFERQKVERRLKKAQKGLDNALASNEKKEEGDTIEKLRQQVETLKGDLLYIRYFPRDRKYMSIIQPIADEEILQQRNQLRNEIISTPLEQLEARAHELEMEEQKIAELVGKNKDDKKKKQQQQHQQTDSHKDEANTRDNRQPSNQPKRRRGSEEKEKKKETVKQQKTLDSDDFFA